MDRAIRSWLYVPADRPELFEKALATEADAIVLDLEDAVAPDRKALARDHAAAFIDRFHGRPVVVRVNPLGAGGDVDVAAVARSGLEAVRLAKAESEADVRTVAEMLRRAGVMAGVVPLLESALAVERAYALAIADPAVRGLAIGEFDLATALGGGEEALAWCRSRVAVAAAACGLPRPPQGAYLDVRDLEGLRRDCFRGRAAGFFGRSAIHPGQVPVINEVYTPDEEDVRAARSLLDSVRVAHENGTGAWLDEHGRLVDAAAISRARATIDLARSVGS
ncbi:MAG: citrate lyase subunit beta / citryl-CoA lyase [Solirubrobacteraceae bacterium]